MTREAFIDGLKKRGHYYKMEGDKIVVTGRGDVWLSTLKSLPPGVRFKNEGDVDLESLTSLPPGVQFNNGGSVYLESLESLPPDVEFRNEDDIYLNSLTRIPSGAILENGGKAFLNSLIRVRFGFHNWKGNIGGIYSKRLLNKMISDGIFDRG